MHSSPARQEEQCIPPVIYLYLNCGTRSLSISPRSRAISIGAKKK